jgi:hypothetical protein
MTEIANAIGFSLERLRELCEEAEGKDKAVITDPEKILCLLDKIDGLSSDLDNAVEVAFKRGATEWVRLNYPEHYKRLTAAA